MAELRSYSHTSYDLEGFEVVEMVSQQKLS